MKNKLQEVSKTNGNNTEYNYTEFSENESYQYLSEQEKGKDRIQERNEYRQLIHDNIEYEILCQSYGTGRVLPHIGMGIVAVIEVVKCGLQDFIFG